MAKYIVTSGTNFNPFTYDELVKPLAQMTEAHNEAQARYDELASNTAQLERYLDDNPDDNYARDIYNNYMSRLQTLQDNLYQRGFGQSTARDLSVARTAYARDIVPMTEAVGRRRKWSDAYKQMQIEHPEMIMGRDPASYSLRDYMEDTNFGGFKNYSTSQLTKDTAVAAAAAAKALAPRPRVWDTSSRVPAGYAETEMTTGYTAAEVDKAMNAFRTGQTTTNDERADELLSIANTIYSQSGLGDWQSESPGAFDRAAAAIGEGMRSAIGETKYEMIQRRDGIYSPAYRAAASKAGKTTKDTSEANYMDFGPEEFVGNPKEKQSMQNDLDWLEDNIDKGSFKKVEATPSTAGFNEGLNYQGTAGSIMTASMLRRNMSNNNEQNKLARLYDKYGLTEPSERTPENLQATLQQNINKAMRRVTPIVIRTTNSDNIGKEIMKKLGVTVDTDKNRLDVLFHEHNTNKPVNRDKIFKIMDNLKNGSVQFTQRPGIEGRIFAQVPDVGSMDIDASCVKNVPIPRNELQYLLGSISQYLNHPEYGTEAYKIVEGFHNAYPNLVDSSGNIMPETMDYLVLHFPEFSEYMEGLTGGDGFKNRLSRLMSEYIFQYTNTLPMAQGDSGTEHRWH